MLQEFKKIIGPQIYIACLTILKAIGPDARTERISVIVAAMLRYALSKLSVRCKQGSLGAALIALEGEPCLDSDQSDEYRRVADLIEELCRESGMRNRRQSARGEPYSIAQSAIAEYCAWYNMPWEQ